MATKACAAVALCFSAIGCARAAFRPVDSASTQPGSSAQVSGWPTGNAGVDTTSSAMGKNDAITVPLPVGSSVHRAKPAIKLLNSRVAGVADILVVPDMESGNMLVKQLEYLGGAELAGVVVGARVPIILTSRADSARARLASCAVAAILANGTARSDATK